MADKIREDVRYPKKLFGTIVGPGGAKIKEVRTATKADVFIKQGDDYIEVQIKGTAEQVQAAKDMVASIAQEEPAREIGGGDPDKKYETLRFEVSAFGVIIGPAGAKVKHIRASSGADVHVQKMGEEVHVSISGTPEEVQWATEMVHKLVQESGKGIACCGKGSGGKGKGGGNRRDTDLSEALEYEEDTFGAIVGKGGAVIHQIRRESGAHVSVDKVLGKCQVQITGNLQQVERAKNLIWENTTGHSWQGDKTQSFEFDHQAMGNIIGPAAKRIQDARRQTGAMITVRKTETGCQVVIAGTESEVQQAQDVVLEIVGSGGTAGSDIQSGSWNDRWEHKESRKHEEIDWKGREAREEEESDIDDEVDMTMPPTDARLVNKIVAKICDDSGAVVTVDDETDKTIAKVNVKGRLRAVDRARAMIYDIISGSKGKGRRRRRGDEDGDWDDEEFLRLGFVDSKRTIGRGGSKVQELERQSWGNIEVAKSQGGPCLVRITGSHDAVSEACRLIEDGLPSSFRPKLGKRKLIQTEFPDFRARSRTPPRKSMKPEPPSKEREPTQEISASARAPAETFAPAEQAVPETNGAPASEQAAPAQWDENGTAGEETTGEGAAGQGIADETAAQQYSTEEWAQWEKEQGEGAWEAGAEAGTEGGTGDAGVAEPPKKRSLIASLLAKNDDAPEGE